MADGKTHARNARRVIYISIPVCAALAVTVDPQAIAGIAGAVVGWIIEPDLGDMHNVTTKSEKRLYKIHPVLGWLWECAWYPLARAIPHRSPLSHLPPLCTAFRLLYVCLVVALALSLQSGYMDVWRQAVTLYEWIKENWQSLRWFYWGFAWWSFQDLIHLAADGFKVNKPKRRRKRSRRRK